MSTEYYETNDHVAIDALYEVADDREAEVLDALRRKAGIVWEHLHCWTNVASATSCERCGKSRKACEDESW